MRAGALCRRTGLLAAVAAVRQRSIAEEPIRPSARGTRRQWFGFPDPQIAKGGDVRIPDCRQIHVGPWVNTKGGDIYLRVSLLGGWQEFAYVDDVALDCIH